MNSLPRTTLRDIRDAGLSELQEKVEAGERLDAEDGLRLFQARDVVAVGALANLVRERLHGGLTYFNRNTHINATNVCEASCVFCSFARLKTGDKDAWTLSVEQAVGRVRALKGELITEVHIVNGLNPDLPFSYYTDLLSAIKAERPDLHIKGFTAVEVFYYAEKYGKSIEGVLRELMAAGLGSIPGGGAEIFHPRARKKLCDDKVDADGWLEVHRVAHRLGLRSNATLLFGSIETLDERVDHLLRLRALQDESLSAAEQPGHGGGHFQTFIPLRFHNDNNNLRALASPTGYDSLRTIAVSRLLLDNFPHVKAYWPMLGTEVAQASLWFGASDLDGTVLEEHIYHMAGADTPQGLTRRDLVRFIEQAGRVPVERDTLYRVLRRCDPLAPPEPLPRPPVVAPVAYTNALPLIRHLDGVQVRPGHPSEVARWLRAGEVDLALLPVGALLGDEGVDYAVVPDLCIGGDGPVESVLLVAERPIGQWRRILLDGCSRTSVLLARLLLQHGPLRAALHPEVEFVEVGIGEGLKGAVGDTAGLVIGDLARELPARLTAVIDLGAAWKDWTGLPFVFAVWAGRPDLDPRLVERVRAGGLRGLQALESGELQAHLGAADARYLGEVIRFPLDDRATMGLMRFAALAHQHGLTRREHWSLYPPPAAAPAPEARRRAVDSALLRGATGERLTEADALLLDQHATLLELGAAANLRRLQLHPDARVTWRLIPEGASAEIDDRVATTAWVHIGGALGPEERVAGLLRLRALQDESRPFTDLGVLCEKGDGNRTATEWMRVTALARLVIDNIRHLRADAGGHGPGLAQAALHQGCDDWGDVPARGALGAAEVERHIRAAGFSPARRDAAFTLQGGPMTEADPEGRPLRRLAPSPSPSK